MLHLLYTFNTIMFMSFILIYNPKQHIISYTPHMKNKKTDKQFEKPVLEIVEFTNDDIITDSFGDPEPGSGDVLPKGWW